MPKLVLPIHIVCHNELINSTIVTQLKSLLDRYPDDSLRYNIIFGSVILDEVCTPRQLSEKIKGRSDRVDPSAYSRLDLLGILARIFKDYEQIEKRPETIFNPEIVIITKYEPVNESYWKGILEKLGAHTPYICTYWWTGSDSGTISATEQKRIRYLYRNLSGDLKNIKGEFKFAESTISGSGSSAPVPFTMNVIRELEGRISKKMLQLKTEGARLAPSSSSAAAPRTPAVEVPRTPPAATPAPAKTPPAKLAESTASTALAVVKPAPAEEKKETTTAPAAAPSKESSSGTGNGTSGVRVISPPAAEPEKKPETPIVAPREPAKWQVIEPAPELKDRVPNILADKLPQEMQGWDIVAASRRGKMHENDGTFREDAFAFDVEAGWVIVAVADGAGSHHLSRVGSNLAVKTAVSVMRENVKKEPPSKPVAKVALQEALGKAWEALYNEAKKREPEGTTFKDLSTTLLLLMYHPQKNIVGCAQVGDGLIAAQLEDKSIVQLGRPESGEYSGTTYFLTNYQYSELASKVDTTDTLPSHPKMFLVMTDGVADDFYPPGENLFRLIKPIPGVLKASKPGDALLDLINYQRAASFDDRTLVVACRPLLIDGIVKASIARPAAPEAVPAPVPAAAEPTAAAAPKPEDAAGASPSIQVPPPEPGPSSTPGNPAPEGTAPAAGDQPEPHPPAKPGTGDMEAKG